jgi:hypothetical protein
VAVSVFFAIAEEGVAVSDGVDAGTGIQHPRARADGQARGARRGIKDS